MKDKWEQIAEQWKRFAGEAQKKWRDLTTDELMQSNGNRKTLVGLIQKRYGITKKAAEKQADMWANTLKV